MSYKIFMGVWQSAKIDPKAKENGKKRKKLERKKKRHKRKYKVKDLSTV